jgi:hypothetical protein
MLQLLSLREGKRPSELDTDSNTRPLLCSLDPPPPLISDAEKGECPMYNTPHVFSVPGVLHTQHTLHENQVMAI